MTNEFDFAKLLIILIGTLSLYWLGLKVTQGTTQRLLLFGLLGGLTFYNGVGAASTEVAPIFIGYYLVFVIAVILGFRMGMSVFSPLGQSFGQRFPLALASMDRSGVWFFILLVYVLSYVIPLVWPEFRLHQLLSPPSPDLRAAFSLRFEREPENLIRLVNYMRLLLTPFFFLALYRLRYRLNWVLFLLVAILYMQYVDDAYISRGVVMMQAGIFLFAVWFLRPKYRRTIIVGSIALLPVLFSGLHAYQYIRLGTVMAVDVGYRDAINSVLTTEFGFLRNVGMPIFEAGLRTDFNAYFIWIVTLPIPKILTGSIEGARINYEISEFVLGRMRGSGGFSIVLPGLVAESLYIYGPHFFWFHGVFVSVVAAFFARILERTPQTLFLQAYICITFAYMLNRGGVGAFLPVIINQFLLFYIFLALISVSRLKRSRRHVLKKEYVSRGKIVNYVDPRLSMPQDIKS